MVVLDEPKVLKALDASLRDNSDEWPEFVLRRARVVSQRTGSMVDLLSARPGHLVTVTGRLASLDKDMAHLAKLPAKQVDTICIRDVCSYSFSQYEDGTFGFWAAGKAGWYEIRTAADNYAPFYQSMEEATSMFYFLADRFSEDEKPRAPEQYVKSLIKDYVKADYSRRRDAADAMDGFYEHRDFLMRSMLEGQEGLEWEHSPFLRHLSKQFPNDYQAAMKNIKASGKPVRELPQEKMEVDSDPRPGRRGTSAKKKIPNARDDMDIDDDNDDKMALGDTVPQHGLRGALRLRAAHSSKRYTGPSAPPQNQASADESSDSESDSDEEFEDANESNAAGEGKHDSFENGLGEIPAGLARFMPQPEYYEPKGPGDTWTCSFDGCTHKIFDARTDKSRGLIEDHFSKSHADEMRALILSESGTSATVKHLLGRLQNVRTMDPEAAKSLASTALPQKVVRRY